MKSKKFILIILVMFLVSLIVVSAGLTRTTYNPFTSKLDYILDYTNFSGNITAQNFFGNLNASYIQNEYWVNITGDKMFGDIDLNNYSIVNINSLTPSVDSVLPSYVEGRRFYVNGTTKKWCQWIYPPDVYACDGADWRRMINKDSVVIPSCTAVSPFGVQGQRMGVVRGSANSDNVSDIIGVTLNNCSVGGVCWVMFRGTIRGQCDTRNYAIGDHLYLNDSGDGALVNYSVQLPDYIVHVGDVLTSELNGQVNVDIKQEFEHTTVFNNVAVRNDTYVYGNVGIGTITPKNSLDVEGSAVIGSSYSGTNTCGVNSLCVENYVGVGTANPQYPLDMTEEWNTTLSTNLLASFTSYNDFTRFVFRQAGGNASSPSATISGKGLGAFSFRGYDTTNGFSAASDAAINAVADQNFNATAHGTRLVFFGTPLGSTTVTEWLRITDNKVGIGTTSPRVKLDINGTVMMEASGTSGFYMKNTAAPFGNTFSAGGAGNPSLVSNFNLSGVQENLSYSSWVLNLQSTLDRIVVSRYAPGNSTPIARIMIMDNETRILNNLNATANASINLRNGGIWIHNDSGISFSVASASIYYNISVLYNQTSIMNGFNSVSNTFLNCTSPGYYFVHFQMSGSGVANHNYHGVILLNGLPQYGSESHIRISSPTDVSGMSSGTNLRLNTGDLVSIGLEDSTGTGTATIYSAGITANWVSS